MKLEKRYNVKFLGERQGEQCWEMRASKMGKDEPISMDSLAKIATALNCGLDDIVEIQKGGAE